ncbi:hypothetical protein ACE1TF_10290 [Geomicrobium sp. JSM 1781026]|uniref:hypothetical protein n=1 Tax=Geomicrobium sp. JSM 1781026 TaxID=3344580 RepID=UPI0035BF443D
MKVILPIVTLLFVFLPVTVDANDFGDYAGDLNTMQPMIDKQSDDSFPLAIESVWGDCFVFLDELTCQYEVTDDRSIWHANIFFEVEEEVQGSFEFLRTEPHHTTGVGNTADGERTIDVPNGTYRISMYGNVEYHDGEYDEFEIRTIADSVTLGD